MNPHCSLFLVGFIVICVSYAIIILIVKLVTKKSKHNSKVFSKKRYLLQEISVNKLETEYKLCLEKAKEVESAILER